MIIKGFENSNNDQALTVYSEAAQTGYAILCMADGGMSTWSTHEVDFTEMVETDPANIGPAFANAIENQNNTDEQKIIALSQLIILGRVSS